jgi:signal transduction histidine kinase
VTLGCSVMRGRRNTASEDIGLQCWDMTLDSTAHTSTPLLEMQHVLNAFEGVVAVVDVQGVIVAVNQAWTHRMNEHGASPLSCGVGANYLLVCDRSSAAGATEAGVVAHDLRAGLAGTVGSVELELPCHGPTQKYWSRLNIRPFEAQTGRYALLQHDDVTAQTVARDRASDLGQQATLRSDLHTQTLRIQNEELDAFIGAVSHDLRTPIRHVQGFLTLLRRKVSGEQVSGEQVSGEPVSGDRWSADERRLLDMIGGASTRLQQMVDELLKLARVSQKALVFQGVDLTAVMQDAWSSLAPEVQGRDLNWVLDALPVVQGDPELLRLAFENVLGNALKYTAKQGAASIRVWATSTDEGWVVAVQDDGAGFDPAQASRLFGAFQRLHSDREFAGIGMGLANVRRICARHGAAVWAESQVGQGATFFVRFPISPHHLQPLAAP